MTALARLWTARGDDWRLSWRPTAPHLTGSAEVIAEIEAVLARDDEIRITPTSAPVPSTISNAEAVLAALDRCGRSFTASAGAPRFESVPDRVY